MDQYRTKIVAGNWKMNTTLQEGERLLDEILLGIPGALPCTVVIAPPLSHLAMAKNKLGETQVKLGAQNCHYEKSGAYTGEVSAGMLKSLGADFVIVGHSERRQGFHETNEIVKRKLDAILNAGLKAIFCCGEPQEIRQTEAQNIFVRLQLEESLFHLEAEQFKNVSIAYEPIWAIGTGVTASPDQAQEMHEYIREQIANRYDKVITECTRILYGGSMKGDNAKSLFTKEDVDGGLVGGASLQAAEFLEIIKAAC